MCVDYRRLSDQTKTVAYPTSRIDECLDHMRETTVYTKMDLRSGFHQSLVFPEHRKRTAFQARWGTFQYCVMPFDLCNAPATFQRTMNSLLQEFHGFCEVYLDDIVVHSRTMEEHARHLALVLANLEKEIVFAKLSKCCFAAPTIEFCGFLVSAHGVATQPDKIALIT